MLIVGFALGVLIYAGLLFVSVIYSKKVQQRSALSYSLNTRVLACLRRDKKRKYKGINWFANSNLVYKIIHRSADLDKEINDIVGSVKAHADKSNNLSLAVVTVDTADDRKDQIDSVIKKIKDNGMVVSVYDENVSEDVLAKQAAVILFVEEKNTVIRELVRLASYCQYNDVPVIGGVYLE